MGVHAAKRLPGFSYVGQCEYSITCCTFKRERLFTKAEIVDAVRTQLLQMATEQQFEIPAYCFMPDHVHVLATATSDDSDLRHFVGRWKQQTGYAYRQRENVTLWQGGFYEHVLRAEEDRVWLSRLHSATRSTKERSRMSNGKCKSQNAKPFASSILHFELQGQSFGPWV